MSESGEGKTMGLEGMAREKTMIFNGFREGRRQHIHFIPKNPPLFDLDK